MKLIVLLVIGIGLFLVGLMRRWREWDARAWVRFDAKLAIAVLLVTAGIWMARATDRGVNATWPGWTRPLWVVAMMLLLFNGVVWGAEVLFEFATDTSDLALLGGYVRFFTILFVLFGLAFWLQATQGVPGERAFFVLAGGSALGLGILAPEWFQKRPGVRAIMAKVGETGVRALYVGIGVCLIGFGVLGNPAGLFK